MTLLKKIVKTLRNDLNNTMCILNLKSTMICILLLVFQYNTNYVLVLRRLWGNMESIFIYLCFCVCMFLVLSMDYCIKAVVLEY